MKELLVLMDREWVLKGEDDLLAIGCRVAIDVGRRLSGDKLEGMLGADVELA